MGQVLIFWCSHIYELWDYIINDLDNQTFRHTFGLLNLTTVAHSGSLTNDVLCSSIYETGMRLTIPLTY